MKMYFHRLHEYQVEVKVGWDVTFEVSLSETTKQVRA